MASLNLFDEVVGRMEKAHSRYGDFASTHEALGVASEEWDEFRAAIHDNDLPQVAHECFDLAAVLIRLARTLQSSKAAQHRSTK